MCLLAMDQVLEEPKIFLSIKFIRASVLNWGTITYTRIISHIHICIHRHYLEIAQIPQIFVVIRPWIRRHRAPKSFWSKKFMRTSILNRRTITYTHTFFPRPILHPEAFFMNRVNLSIFRMY